MNIIFSLLLFFTGTQQGVGMEKMLASQKAFNLITKWEKLELKSYQCPAGVWTIGFGHTRGVRAGMEISRDTAYRFLLDDVMYLEEKVNELVKVKLTQGQFDALISFAFNFGWPRLKHSTLLKKVNQGKNVQAALEFSKWINATVNGKKKVLRGLVYRRAQEALHFSGLYA